MSHNNQNLKTIVFKYSLFFLLITLQLGYLIDQLADPRVIFRRGWEGVGSCLDKKYTKLIIYFSKKIILPS